MTREIMDIRLVFMLLFLLCLVVKSSSTANLITSTDSGSYQGIRLNPQATKTEVHAYLGIPYAQPPIGDLRFQKPKPFKSESGLHEATAKPPSCIQYAFRNLPWIDNSTSTSEDCLYLNIWVPQSHEHTEELKPVMIWIHGGSFAFGSTQMDIYDGQTLAGIGNVVVVTFNYRLGVFGFFSSFTEDAPGNVGIYDQLLALKWVKRNIRNFGGDPELITLFGESSGAKSVGMHALSSSSHGLFTHIILQSGSLLIPIGQTPDQNLQAGDFLARLNGCADYETNLLSNPTKVINCLKKIDAKKLSKSTVIPESPIPIQFLPQDEDDIPSEYHLQSQFLGNVQKRHLFIGLNKDEGNWFLPYLRPQIFGDMGQKNIKLNKTTMKSILTDIFESFHLSRPEKISEFYLKDIPEDNYKDILQVSGEALADFRFVCPSILFAESYADQNSKVYFYLFNHRPSTTPWPEWLGVAHFEEVQFVFGMPLRYPSNYTLEERQFSEDIIKIWASFAKTGTPPLGTSSSWPLYSKNNPFFVELNPHRISIGNGLKNERQACEFWKPYFGVE